MLLVKAHYDGEHIVLDEDVALKHDQKVVIVYDDGAVSKKRKSLLDALKAEHPTLTEEQRNEIADYAEFLSLQNGL